MSYDSDDDYVICQDCEKMCDVSEIKRVILCTSKKVMLCLDCKRWLENADALENISDYEDYEDEDYDDAIAQPVRMIVKVWVDANPSCCGLKSCVRIICCGTVHGHVSLSSCDPELVNYPLGLFSKTNMHWVKDAHLNGRIVSRFVSDPFEETNLLRRLRLQKTQRLNKLKEKEIEQLKVKKQKVEEDKSKKLEVEHATRLREKVEEISKEMAMRYKYLQEEKQKERWESLPIWDKIVELEVQLCYKLHGSNWNYSCASGGRLGQRLALYENVRFKELQKSCPVIEQASRAIYNFAQPIHLQIDNPYEKKDQPEKILVILEKWLEDVDPTKYNEIKGLSGAPPSVFPSVPPGGFFGMFNIKKNTI